MVFHLDKCIGCHTCSIACKNIWTDRKGAEYQWWNNVETKPGTGYPSKWEDQSIYNGGWEKKDNGSGNGAGNGSANGNGSGGVQEISIKLKGAGKAKGLGNIFHNPSLPVIDDYYEPFTYKYLDLIEAKAGDDQPTARPVSLIDGKPIDIKSGPNWDDDLSGTPDYARKDPNLENLSPEEQEAMFQLEKMAFFYLPRICNHCSYPACVDACPRNAIYKREEDGAVVIDQERCKGYRFCLEACPYKVIYFNFINRTSMKCIFCYPRLEEKVANACARQCTGRVRFVGFLDNKKGLIHKLVHVWKVALPLHPEYGTEPNVFYVPPLSPPRLDESGKVDNGKDRIPLAYLRYLFGPEVEGALATLKKEMAKVRNGGKSELMEILISKEWRAMFGPFREDPAKLERKPVRTV